MRYVRIAGVLPEIELCLLERKVLTVSIGKVCHSGADYLVSKNIPVYVGLGEPPSLNSASTLKNFKQKCLKIVKLK